MPKRRRRKTTAVQLQENEFLYRKQEDPMIVHQTAVDAAAGELRMPDWVVREWTKWSRKLVKIRGESPSLTPVEIGRALELLDTGPGRGTPSSRAHTREFDARIARVLDRMREEEGVSLETARAELADLLGWTEDALRNRYARHRKRLKTESS